MMQETLKAIARCWKPLLILNSAIAGAAIFSSASVEDEWGARASLILPNNTSELNANFGTLGDLSGGEGLVFSQQIDSRQILSSIMLSDDTVRRVWEQDPEQSQFSSIDAYKAVFEVESVDSSTIIELTAEGSTPELAQERLTELIRSFQQRLNDLRQKDAAQRSGFLENAIRKAALDLDRIQRQLADFQKESNIVDIDNQTQQLVQSLNALGLSQRETTAQFEASRARSAMLSERLGQSPEAAIQALRLGEDTYYQTLQQRLSEVEVLLTEAQSQFTDAHPQVRTLLLERNQLASQLSQHIAQNVSLASGPALTVGDNSASLIEELILAESQTRALEQQASQLQNQINNLSTSLERIPDARARLLELERQYNIAEGVYNGLIAQVEATRVNAFSTYPSVQVLDFPAISPDPLGPGSKLIYLGAILASLFGSAAVVLLVNSRSPLLTQDDLRKTAFPVIGKVGHLQLVPNASHLSLDPVSRAAFGSLSSTITSSSFGKGQYLITSASSGDGKTTVTHGLALSLADLGFRVLVVTSNSSVPTSEGSYLSSFDSLNGGLELTPTVINSHIDLLSLSQISNTGEFIAQGKLQHLVGSLQKSKRYDYILFDSPCLEDSNEAILLSNFVSNILFVVRPSTAHKRLFNECLTQLSQQPSANIRGFIVNDSASSVSFQKPSVPQPMEVTV